MNNRVAKGLFWGGNLGIVYLGIQQELLDISRPLNELLHAKYLHYYLGRVPDDNVIEGLRKNDLVLSEKLTKEFPIGRLVLVKLVIYAPLY